MTLCDNGAEALLRIGAERPDVLVLLTARLPGAEAVTLIITLRRSMNMTITVGVGPGDAEIAMERRRQGHAGRVVTPHKISRHVWRSTVSPPDNTIAVHLKRLRRRIGDDEKTRRSS